MSGKKSNQGDPLVIYDKKKRTARVDIEKRIENRLEVNRSVFVGHNDQNVTSGKIKDLSSGGALLDSKLKLAVNDMIEVRWDLNSLPFARARVVRKSDNGLWGLKWIEFFEEQMVKGVLTKNKT